MRTFHVGGAASRAAVASQVETQERRVRPLHRHMRYVTSAKGEKIVITRSGEVLITDDNGREREKHKVPYGATLQVADGQAGQGRRQAGHVGSAHASDHCRILGQVKFENVEEGVTVAKQIDEVTGLSTLVVIDPKRGGKARPRACVRRSSCSTKRRRSQDARQRPCR
jgi:DNA-directed RNA polymerase subunit beta'